MLLLLLLVEQQQVIEISLHHLTTIWTVLQQKARVLVPEE
jgi:hypothetical protein